MSKMSRKKTAKEGLHSCHWITSTALALCNIERHSQNNVFLLKVLGARRWTPARATLKRIAGKSKVSQFEFFKVLFIDSFATEEAENTTYCNFMNLI